MLRPHRVLGVSAALAFLVGCELIVSSTVPDFRCTPGDPTSCPPGMTCERGTLQCITGSGTEAGTSGGTKDAEPDDGEAGPATTGQVGEPCDSTQTCAAGFTCGTASILTAGIVKEAGDAFCTKTCCTSADCPDGFVCFGPGTGGNWCISSAKAKRGDLGAKTPGASCSGNEECRSGVCGDGHCQDICCSDKDCKSPTICRVKSIEVSGTGAHENWVCAVPEANANTAMGSSCSGAGLKCINDDCSGFPVRCRPPCCSSAECAAADVPGNTKKFAFCSYGQFPSTSAQTRWCFDVVDGGTGKAIGEDCNGNGDCAERFCDQDTRRCAKVCCRDSDCSDGEACVPSLTATPFLHCVKAGQ